MAEASCPFCEAEVEEALLLYGGTCPKCFGEIPGEETPTDPGDAVNARIALQDKRRALARSVVPLALAVPVVLGVAAAAVALLLFRSPEADLFDLDQGDWAMEDEVLFAALAGDAGDDKTDAIEAPPDDTDAVEPRTASNGSSGGPPEVRRPKLGGPTPAVDPSKIDLGGDDGPDVAGPRSRKGTADATPDFVKRTTTAGTGPGLADGPEVTVGNVGLSTGRVITDPAEIKRMVAERLGAQLRRLQPCYQRRLNADPSLRGRWELRFTVKKDGTTKGGVATGLSTADSELEECLVRKVSEFRFELISQAQPVKKTVTFQPGR